MQIISYGPRIVLVLGVIIITIYFFYMLSKSNEEGFINIDDAISEAKNTMKDSPPTDDQMAGIYKSFLLYIKNDFSKGLTYVHDLNKRIYGRTESVDDKFDPRKLLDNYKNPLTGL